jgi:hypothetical protein
MTPDEWLADFEAKTAELQRNAAAFRRNLEMAGQTVTSEDKTLTVTVAPNGALLDLKIAQNPELACSASSGTRSADRQDSSTPMCRCRHSVHLNHASRSQSRTTTSATTRSCTDQWSSC